MVMDAFHSVQLTQNKPAADQKVLHQIFLKLLKRCFDDFFSPRVCRIRTDLWTHRSTTITLLCGKTTDNLLFCIKKNATPGYLLFVSKSFPVGMLCVVCALVKVLVLAGCCWLFISVSCPLVLC